MSHPAGEQRRIRHNRLHGALAFIQMAAALQVVDAHYVIERAKVSLADQSPFGIERRSMLVGSSKPN
jgi:hypothetical protein